MIPLRYTDRSVRDVPWWKHHTTRYVRNDPPIMPIFGWRWLLRRRRRNG